MFICLRVNRFFTCGTLLPATAAKSFRPAFSPAPFEPETSAAPAAFFYLNSTKHATAAGHFSNNRPRCETIFANKNSGASPLPLLAKYICACLEKCLLSESNNNILCYILMLFFKDYAIMSNTDIESARRTIDKEIDALRIMESKLDENLTKALDMMQSSKDASSSPEWENPDTSARKSRQRWLRPARLRFSSIRRKPATATWAC